MKNLPFHVVSWCGVIVSLLAISWCFAGEREEVSRLSGKYGNVEWNAMDQRIWKPARTEVVLWDMTRVDMVNEDYAIEVDYPEKWAEAIGQSLYYATVTGKKPGVIVLVTDFQKDMRYVYRLQTVAAKHGISVWVENVVE